MSLLIECSKARDSILEGLYCRTLASGLEGTLESHMFCPSEKKRRENKKREIFTRASLPSKGFLECQHNETTPPRMLQSKSLTQET